MRSMLIVCLAIGAAGAVLVSPSHGQPFDPARERAAQEWRWRQEQERRQEEARSRERYREVERRREMELREAERLRLERLQAERYWFYRRECERDPTRCPR